VYVGDDLDAGAVVEFLVADEVGVLFGGRGLDLLRERDGLGVLVVGDGLGITRVLVAVGVR
jgi:hypothetical protein